MFRGFGELFQGLSQKARLYVYVSEGFEGVPCEVDLDSGVGGGSFPFRVEDGLISRCHLVYEKDFVAAFSAETEEIFDDPYEAFDAHFAAEFFSHFAFQGCFGVFAHFDSSAGEDVEVCGFGGLEEDVVFVEAGSGHSVVEAVSVFLEGDHLQRILIKRAAKMDIIPPCE